MKKEKRYSCRPRKPHKAHKLTPLLLTCIPTRVLPSLPSQVNTVSTSNGIQTPILLSYPPFGLKNLTSSSSLLKKPHSQVSGNILYTMKAILTRTGSSCSVLVHSSFFPCSPRLSLSGYDSVSGVFSGDKNLPRISLHLVVNQRPIRRAFSEPDMIPFANDVSCGFTRLTRARSQLFPAKIPEEECVSGGEEEVVGAIGSLLAERGLDHERDYFPRSGIPLEELGFSGDGIGKGRMSDGGRGGNDFGTSGGSADRSKIGAYYQEMLKSDPTNPLLLRNYGKFLHEVEGDAVKTEECYGRAILACPGDGELLSLYGKLILETQKDGDRAKSYFSQAVQASPDDCMVLGSYAQFMWEAEEEDEGREVNEVSPATVKAF